MWHWLISQIYVHQNQHRIKYHKPISPSKHYLPKQTIWGYYINQFGTWYLILNTAFYQTLFYNFVLTVLRYKKEATLKKHLIPCPIKPWPSMTGAHRLFSHFWFLVATLVCDKIIISRHFSPTFENSSDLIFSMIWQFVHKIKYYKLHFLLIKIDY